MKQTDKIHELLFPALKDRHWGYVNFGEEAFLHDAAMQQTSGLGCSEHLVSWVHTKLGIECSFGGYMEDRSFLMRHQYQKPGETWHLGIDYTVPEGTLVHLPCDAELHSFSVDPDMFGGWGGKVIFKTPKGFLIFGHLDHFESKLLFLSIPKTNYKAGDLIGTIAGFEKNGGWYPHLHVQAVAYNQFDDENDGYSHLENGRLNPQIVDGYSRLYDGIEKDFPRPDLMIQELRK